MTRPERPDPELAAIGGRKRRPTIPAGARMPLTNVSSPSLPASARTGPDPPDYDPEGGLTAAAVARRLLRGQTNESAFTATQSLREILARNTLTWLNLLLVVLGAATLATGSAPDATFLAIAVANSTIGTVQEVRAKRTLDALAVVHAPKVRVWRDGQLAELPVAELVMDDLMDLRPGDQVVVDAEVVADRGDVDESLATGEADPISKGPGDRLLSGSWLVAGSIAARVVAVGADTYAARLAHQARRFALADSELMQGINRILRWLSVAMVVIAPLLIIRQLEVSPWRIAVRAATAGLVGMIPEGLVLLTTMAFLGAAVKLGRQRVLVQELPAVEGLARVDTLCTDKTGTLTRGRTEWAQLHLPAGAAGVADAGTDGATGGRDEIVAALAGLAGSREANTTMVTIAEALPHAEAWEITSAVAFSSARKWSAATFVGHGTWVLGAPDVVGGADPGDLGPRMEVLASSGRRVLVLARTDQPLDAGFGGAAPLPAGLVVTAAVELREQVRAEAAATLAFFADQQVTIRVVSGDNPATAAAVAHQVGLSGAERPLDARRWPDDPAELGRIVEGHTVFGRVSPEQKCQIVDVLRAQGHVVAMTGDGVNDTLALKHADLGIAMGSGSPVARGVAQIVLLDDQFDALPAVVAAGRQVLRNVERVAALFLVKNVYSLLLSVVIAITGWPYPFLPRHLTLISGIAIGIPGLFLAFAPSDERFRPGFVRRVLSFSLGAGTITAVAVLLTYAGAREESTAPAQARTAAILVTVVISLWVLLVVSRPLRPWKVALTLAMASLFMVAYLTPGLDTFFSLRQRPSPEVVLQAMVFGAGACALISLLDRLQAFRRDRRKACSGRLDRGRSTSWFGPGRRRPGRRRPTRR